MRLEIRMRKPRRLWRYFDKVRDRAFFPSRWVTHCTSDLPVQNPPLLCKFAQNSAGDIDVGGLLALQCYSPAPSGHSISPKKAHTLNSIHYWCCNATRRIDTGWAPARLIPTLP